MAKYFESVGTKSVIKSKEIFSYEGSKPEELFNHYESIPKELDSNLEAVDQMFMEWCDTLFSGFNIVVFGPLSKYKILNTFWKRYLASGRIPDLSCQLPQNGKTNLNIKTVKLHGLISVSKDKFIHILFKQIENISKNGNNDYSFDEEIKLFLDSIRKKKIHYVFLIHSFELLYTDSKDIYEIIFHELYRLEPNYIHIILSSDHVSAGKILHTIKHRMQFVFYSIPYGESFLYEKTQAVSIFDNDFNADDNNASNYDVKVTSKFVGDQLNLQTLKDVHDAVQKDCLKVLVYIIQHFVDRSQMPAEFLDAKKLERFGSACISSTPKKALFNDVDNSRAGGDSSRVNANRRQTRSSKASATIQLEFEELMDFYQREFLVRRPQVLKGHLEELIDHKIIKYDETGNRIQCLLNIGTCKKFLEYLEKLEQN